MHNPPPASIQHQIEVIPEPYQISPELEDRAAVPPLSVVMPVHNALPFLSASIASILNQTFGDFELVILDDASTDGSGAVLRQWAGRDPRIRLFAGRKQLGLPGSSNFVVRQARAPIVARMDADDLARRDRLARQWRVLQTRPDVVLVGALADGIDSAGRQIRPRDRWRLARRSFSSPFPHGSAMFRRQAWLDAGGYREQCTAWEDLDLFLRLAKQGRVLVFPEALYHYRHHPNHTALSLQFERTLRTLVLRHRCISLLRRRGCDYAHLFERKENSREARKFLPRTLYTVGYLRLWSGQSPAIVGRLLDRGAWLSSPLGPLVFAWALWGSHSPASLKAASRGVLRVRDWLAGHRIKDGRLYEWRLR